MTRRLARRAAVLAAVVVGWSQPVPGAEAAFSSAASATNAVTAHTLATPVLSCNSGGALSTTLTLSWPAVASATTADPYGPGSTFLADGYRIQRATGGGGFSPLSTVGLVTSTTDSPGGLLTTYHYKIQSKKQGWFSALSNQVSVTTTALGVLQACTSP